ncbi:MAG: sensor domain-containing diguanylate cyclase [Lachnospiraceae bacterium]|nr:sensor domain-containing diguanylate cyclase [Lachnospiraceae bacterium]
MKRLLALIRDNRLVRLNFIMVVVALCFSILISFFSLHYVTMKDREQNTSLVFQTLYTSIHNALEAPAQVTKTMSNDSFLQKMMQAEDSMDPKVFEREIATYLGNLQAAHQWETAYVVSAKTLHYYTSEGMVKTLDETKDPYDLWYQNFLNTGMEYGADMSYDQQHNNIPSIYIDRRLEVDGKLLGLTGCAIYLTDVSDLLTRYSKEYDVNVYFTDVDGNVTLDKTGATITTSYLARSYQNEYVDRSSEYHNGTYTIRQYIPLLGMYLVVENSQHVLSRLFMPILVLNILYVFIFAIIITVVNHTYFQNEKSELRRKVRTDYLTKVSNVDGLEHNISAFVEDEANYGIGATLFILDIDHFKQINDTFGHTQGDELLIRFAHALTKSFRGGDIIGRLGGDEFMVFSPTMTEREAIERKAIELNKNLCDYICDDEHGTIQTTVSIGIAIFPADGLSYRDLYKSADAALYYVKEHGRNGHCYCGDLKRKE